MSTPTPSEEDNYELWGLIVNEKVLKDDGNKRAEDLIRDQKADIDYKPPADRKLDCLHPNYYSRGWTGLCHAAYEGNILLARWLLDHGAKVGARSSSFCMWSSWWRVEYFSPLAMATYKNRAHIARMLLQKGADPNEKNPDTSAGIRNFENYSLLEMAVELDNTDVADVLLEFRANPNIVLLKPKKNRDNIKRIVAEYKTINKDRIAYEQEAREIERKALEKEVRIRHESEINALRDEIQAEHEREINALRDEMHREMKAVLDNVQGLIASDHASRTSVPASRAAAAAPVVSQTELQLRRENADLKSEVQDLNMRLKRYDANDKAHQGLKNPPPLQPSRKV